MESTRQWDKRQRICIQIYLQSVRFLLLKRYVDLYLVSISERLMMTYYLLVSGLIQMAVIVDRRETVLLNLHSRCIIAVIPAPD